MILLVGDDYLKSLITIISECMKGSIQNDNDSVMIKAVKVEGQGPVITIMTEFYDLDDEYPYPTCCTFKFYCKIKQLSLEIIPVKGYNYKDRNERFSGTIRTFVIKFCSLETSRLVEDSVDFDLIKIIYDAWTTTDVENTNDITINNESFMEPHIDYFDGAGLSMKSIDDLDKVINEFECSNKGYDQSFYNYFKDIHDMNIKDNFFQCKSIGQRIIKDS